VSTRLLEVEGLTVSYGGLVAVDDVDLGVADGQIAGLIGPNGAGKTTCIDAIAGFTAGRAGSITFAGHRIDGLPPHRRARLGLARTFQSVELFDDLTLAENLVVAAAPVRWWSPILDAVAPARSRRVDVEWALTAVGLDGAGDLRPDGLSYGQRRLAGLARAIAGRPRLVLLDEPAAGLDTNETESLAERLRSLPELGISVLLVDHDMGLVLGTCEHITVLDFGRVLAAGPPATIRGDATVIEAYLGEGHREPDPPTRGAG